MGKTLRVIAAALLLTLVLSAEGRAQDWFWGVEYMVSSSTGDTRDFVKDFSFRNFAVEGRNMVKDNVSVGLYLGWNVFAEKTDSLIEFNEATTVSGVQFRYVNAFPIMATAHYYFGQRRGIRPYVGTGLGTYYAENRLEIGTVAFQDKNWHLGVAPEVGVVIPISWNARAILNARYNYGLKSGGTKLSYFTFGVGIGWL
ncbi:MAG: outer membrane beta-barrel protein [Gemmatimonadota bacterium]|nr:MAG: outer membrane beta-barrel protein [Gemmatimonadota bacterium]